MQALVPRDEADEHSAILEVRAGGCGGGAHAIYKIATEMFTVQLRVTSHCLSNHCYCTLLLYTVIVHSCMWTGAGGQEASLFAAEIFLMYQK